jgi:hypothetical protein
MDQVNYFNQFFLLSIERQRKEGERDGSCTIFTLRTNQSDWLFSVSSDNHRFVEYKLGKELMFARNAM